MTCQRPLQQIDRRVVPATCAGTTHGISCHANPLCCSRNGSLGLFRAQIDVPLQFLPEFIETPRLREIRGGTQGKHRPPDRRISFQMAVEPASKGPEPASGLSLAFREVTRLQSLGKGARAPAVRSPRAGLSEPFSTSDSPKNQAFPSFFTDSVTFAIPKSSNPPVLEKRSQYLEVWKC